MGNITRGDTVKIKSDAKAVMKPGSLAEVIGIRQVENATQEKEFGIPLGATILYLEFKDGTAIEVPEEWVELK
jgi:hypothetical protein